MRVGVAFVLAVTITTGSAVVVEVTGRDGAVDEPLDNNRDEVADASDVDVISTHYNTNEHTHARYC